MISRRHFIRSTAAAVVGGVGFPYVISASVLGGNGNVPPSEKIVMGCIGAGSMGGGHVRAFLRHNDVRIAAVCDVRRIFRQKAKRRVDEYYGDEGCAVYDDFRRMLARPDKRFRLACELARNGRIGRLHTIIVGSHPSIQCPNQTSEAAPAKKEFDYDRWLGPAPWRPYSYLRCASRAMGTPGHWTFISDYSLGGLSGAWGIHHVDIAQWANGTDDTGPIRVRGMGVFPRDGLCDTAIAWEVEHEYANGVKMIHANTKRALKLAPQFSSHYGCGVLFLGTEGWALACRDFVDAHPKSLLDEGIGAGEVRLPVSNDHRRNFLDCVKSRAETMCPVETAVRSDTICHLDHIAMMLGRTLKWDPLTEEFVDDETANRMLTRPMRSPWHL